MNAIANPFVLPDDGAIESHRAVVTCVEVGYLPEEERSRTTPIRRLLRCAGRLTRRTLAQVDPVVNHYNKELCRYDRYIRYDGYARSKEPATCHLS
jgi:hypothetical protein